MRSLKRILAIVLILAMTLSLGVGAFADPADEAKIDGAALTSPVDPDPPLPNPGYDPKTKIDTNSQDYNRSHEEPTPTLNLNNQKNFKNKVVGEVTQLAERNTTTTHPEA